jgi:hypothetical protein
MPQDRIFELSILSSSEPDLAKIMTENLWPHHWQYCFSQVVNQAVETFPTHMPQQLTVKVLHGLVQDFKKLQAG